MSKIEFTSCYNDKTFVVDRLYASYAVKNSTLCSYSKDAIS